MPTVTNSKSQRPLGSRETDGTRKRSKSRQQGRRPNNNGTRPRSGEVDVVEVTSDSRTKALKDEVVQKPSFRPVPDDFPALTRNILTQESISSSPFVQMENISMKPLYMEQPLLSSTKPEMSSELVPVASLKMNRRSGPRKMIQDQFGLSALIGVLRKAEEEPDLVTLSLGIDLTNLLSLSMKGTENMHSIFGGPWAESPIRAENLPWDVPACYRFSESNCPVQSASIRKKLFPLKVEELKDEVLFYLFYTFTQDVLQQMAAMELYKRDWRFHIEERVWITPIPGTRYFQRTQYHERGLFFFFDPITWKKVSREFCVEFSKLENRPALPSSSLLMN